MFRGPPMGDWVNKFWLRWFKASLSCATSVFNKAISLRASSSSKLSDIF